MRQISNTIREVFPLKKIVVVGDIVADQFLHGTIARVSREAPVFILRHDETQTSAGGAANAATGVAALGGQAVLIGVVGEDENGALLLEKLKNSKVDCALVVVSEKIRTTTKVRVLAGQQYAPRHQVIRIDYENQTAIDAERQNRLEKNLALAVENADAIVISDYNYGVANKSITDLARQVASEKNIPLLVDSRFNLNNFSNATTATPNQEEVEQILGKNFTEADCVELRRKLGLAALLITRGSDGMLLIEKDKSPAHFEAVGAKEPIDVTGAGDTVIAAYSLGLASGMSFSDAAILANHAGGIVVMKKGTASVNPVELLESLIKNTPASKSQTTL